MLDIFHGLRLVVKKRSINIDNAIFRCHWFFTSTLLVSFSVIITARQYVGQPIECHSVNKIPESLLNSYCWVQGTFTVPQACNLQVGLEVPFPCIDNTRGREIKVYAYYQWVGMVLFIQGLMFHFPYYLWKVWENGLISAITSGLRVALLSDQERAKKRTIVVEYIYEHLGCHRSYAYKYFLCEFICLINLLAQLWCVNRFFDGQFLRYGLDVMQFSSTSSVPATFPSASKQSQAESLHQLTQTSHLIGNHSLQATILNTSEVRDSNIKSSTNLDYIPARLLVNQNRGLNNLNQRQSQPVDPMTFIFPRMTKCTYYDFGSSGDVQKHDALCLLPLNIINEKIYIALWFWFLILAILTILVIIYRFFAFVSLGVRSRGLISRCKLSSELDIQLICANCDVGDWFLFYMVAENLDPIVMREIVASVAQKIQDHYELKEKLMLEEEDNDIGKSFASDGWQILARHRGNSLDESDKTTSDRRELSIIQKVKKRLYPKRLWSMDLGSGEMRQRLFGQQSSVEDPLFDPARQQIDSSSGSQYQVSAPPANQMPLDSAPITRIPTASQLKRVKRFQRWSSLTNSSMDSATNYSAATTETPRDSFVMEMQTISQRSSQSNFVETNRDRISLGPSGVLNNRRRASVGNNLHPHHRSISSMRDLDLER